MFSSKNFFGNLFVKLQQNKREFSTFFFIMLDGFYGSKLNTFFCHDLLQCIFWRSFAEIFYEKNVRSQIILGLFSALQYTVYTALKSVHFVLHNTHCTLYTVHCIEYTVYGVSSWCMDEGSPGQCTARISSVYHCTKLYCTALQCIVQYSVLHCTAVYCTVHCTALHCSVLYSTLYCTAAGQ